MNMSQQRTLAAKLINNLLGCIRQSIASRSWGLIFLLCSYYWDSIWSAESNSGPYRAKEGWVYWSESSEGPQRWFMIFDMRRGWKNWACSVCKEAGSEDSHPYVKIPDVSERQGGSTTPLSGAQWDSTKASQDGQWAQTETYRILPEHKKTSTVRMVKQWNRLSREVVESLKMLFDCTWLHLTLREQTCTFRDPWQNVDGTNCS